MAEAATGRELPHRNLSPVVLKMQREGFRPCRRTSSGVCVHTERVPLSVIRVRPNGRRGHTSAFMVASQDTEDCGSFYQPDLDIP